MKTSKILLTVSILALLLTGASAYLAAHIGWLWKATGVLAIVSFLGFLITDAKEILGSLSKRKTQYGINAVVTCILALAITIIVNYIASSYDTKWDFTKNKSHTLSDQTVKVLKGLKDEVKMRLFVGPDQQSKFDRIVSKYTYYSPLLKKDYIDVDKEPLAVQKYGIRQPGTIIIESANRSSKVDNIFGPDDPKVEEKITNAIISVAKGDKKKIYFIVGHGERQISDSTPEGYSEVKTELESSRYKVEELPLVGKDKIPADAEILIIPGPKSDWLEHEIKMVQNYINQGGKVLLMVEPNSTTSIQPLLTALSVKWVPKKTVVETNPLQQLTGGNPLTPVVASYSGSHEITQGMRANQVTIFAIATPIEKAEKIANDQKVDSLFSTSTQSFEGELEKDKLRVNQKTDRHGPLSLAVAVSGKVKTTPAAPTTPKPVEKKDDTEKKEQEFRVVVVGDADFAGNGLLRKVTNSDLFQNMLSWLAKEEDLISIRPKAADVSEFEITEERFRIIHFASIWLLPPMLLMSGIGIWMSRRRK